MREARTECALRCRNSSSRSRKSGRPQWSRVGFRREPEILVVKGEPTRSAKVSERPCTDSRRPTVQRSCRADGHTNGGATRARATTASVMNFNQKPSNG